jgi:type I restriction enzyme S subunit
MVAVITENLDLWSSAMLNKSTAGRGTGDKQTAYGIKKLRELILELAVQGKLVPQEPNDEPAYVLLERMSKERTLLLEEKKIKPAKKLPTVDHEEKFFELPIGWEFVRLNDIGEWGAGATPSRSRHQYYGGNIPWFKSGELTDDYISDSEEHITELALKETSLRYNKPGDVLIAMYGATIGKTSILKSPGTTNQAVCACTPFNGVSNVFLLTLLKAYKYRFIGMGWGGAQPNISREKIIATVIGLPPLAEQLRIVAKVDELMALCDQLEQQQTDSIAAHQTLVQTLLDTLTQAVDAAEFEQAWSRVAGHFDTLFTTESSIDQLKKTLLQLAVMGKLVPQDSYDEPANVLLEKIAAEKAQLIESGKIKKQSLLAKVTDEEKIFPLPKNWVWARLQDVIDVRDGTHDSPKDAFGPNTYPLVTSKNFNNGDIDFEGARRISAEDHFEISKRSLVEKYDILFSMIGGNLGNQVMVKDDREFSVKNVALFKYYSKELTSPFFVKKYMEHLALDLQEKAIGGAQPFVSLGFLRNLVFALPPINEQQRIVAKVDELMALCDALKARIAAAQTTQIQLADAIVEQAVA